MQAISATLQPAREPADPHPRPKMQWIDHESQRDWMGNRGILMKAWLYQANMHFHFSCLFAATHSEVGGSTSWLEIDIKFWNICLQVRVLVLQLTQSRNMPESGTDHTLLVLGARSAMQLDHKKVASPPADCPVTMMSVATEKTEKCWSMELSCPIVALCPLKYSLTPLYQIGSFLKP